jgi:dipeptidyl aminopeptidase/acylaminoacyl peptidase
MAARTAVRFPTVPLLARFGLAALAVLVAAATVFVLGTAYAEAAKWTHPVRRPVTSTPADVGLVYEDVRLVTEDGLHLAAWYIPSTNGAAIVVLHGIGGNRAGDLGLDRDLAERGYGLIIPDLRAHGDSDGDVCTLGLLEVRDVRAAVDYLNQRPDVDPERLGVHGSSMGASVAMMSAAEMPELRVIVATSGFASVEWVVQHQFAMLESVPQWLAPVVVAMGSWQAGVNVRDIAPVQRIGRISPRPILIIHGDEDETFTVDNAHLLYDAAGDPRDTWIIPGAGHGGSTGPYGSDPEAYAERVGSFFDRALQPIAARAADSGEAARETGTTFPAGGIYGSMVTSATAVPV